MFWLCFNPTTARLSIFPCKIGLRMREVVSGVSDVSMATSLLLSRNLAGMGLEQEVPPPPRLGD